MMSFFRKNLSEKCLALVVAIGCWIFVMNDQNPQIENTYDIPISIVNAPEGYQVSKDTEEVKMRVRAPRSLFTNIDVNNLKAYVDLNGVENGTHELQVQTVLPSGFELVSIGPSKISINVDEIEQKEVPVRLELSGTPGDGKVVASVNQSLQNITVEGPGSILNKVTAVVGYIGVNGNTDNFSVTVPLRAVDDQGKEIESVRLLPKTVDVAITLARGLNRKIVDVKPTLMSDLPNNYILKSVKVEPDKIEVSGDENIIGSMTYLPTENISLSELTGSTALTVNLVLPESVSVSNNQVMVRIEIENKDNVVSDNNENKKN